MATNHATCQCGVCAMLSQCRPQPTKQLADKDMLKRLHTATTSKPYNPQINYALITATKALHRMDG